MLLLQDEDLTNIAAHNHMERSVLADGTCPVVMDTGISRYVICALSVSVLAFLR